MAQIREPDYVTFTNQLSMAAAEATVIQKITNCAFNKARVKRSKELVNSLGLSNGQTNYVVSTGVKALENAQGESGFSHAATCETVWQLAYAASCDWDQRRTLPLELPAPVIQQCEMVRMSYLAQLMADMVTLARNRSAGVEQMNGISYLIGWYPGAENGQVGNQQAAEQEMDGDEAMDEDESDEESDEESEEGSDEESDEDDDSEDDDGGDDANTGAAEGPEEPDYNPNPGHFVFHQYNPAQDNDAEIHDADANGHSAAESVNANESAAADGHFQVNKPTDVTEQFNVTEHFNFNEHSNVKEHSNVNDFKRLNDKKRSAEDSISNVNNKRSNGNQHSGYDEQGAKRLQQSSISSFDWNRSTLPMAAEEPKVRIPAWMRHEYKDYDYEL